MNSSITARGLNIGLLALLMGCAPANRAIPTHLIGKQLRSSPTQAQIVYTPATLRATYFADDDRSLRYCAEPMPDASSDQVSTTTVDVSQKASVEASNGVASGKGSADTSGKVGRDQKTTTKEMAGRSSAVLMSRELMYRLCELSLNFKPGSPEYESAAKKYESVLAVITHIAMAEKLEAAAKRTSAEGGRARDERALIEITAEATRRGGLAALYAVKFQASVTKSDGAKCVIDAEKLKTALSDSKFDGLRGAISQARDCLDLQGMLVDLAVETLKDLMDAAQGPPPPKKG